MTTRENALLMPHGMTYVRPDLVPPNKWRLQRNMRFDNGRLEQVERKKVLTRVENGHKHHMVFLGNIANQTVRRSSVVGLTKEAAYYLTAGETLVKMTCKGLPSKFNHTGVYERWSTTTYNGHIWFVNPQNTVCYTDGTEVFQVGGECPAGRYVEVFYDHLFVAAPMRNGLEEKNKLAFSDLYNFQRFQAKTVNEAGSRHLTDYDSPQATISGLTGMARLGNKLVAYTDSSVYGIDYVGLPHIIHVNPIVEGVGNSIHHCVVSTGTAHYFFSLANRQFYELTSQGVNPIGDDIAEYFFPFLESNYSRPLQLWGHHDPTYGEIWWYMDTNPSSNDTSPPTFTEAVVYNYRTKEWYVAEVEDLHAFVTVQGLVSRFNEYTGIGFDTLGGVTLSSLGAKAPTTGKRFWGGNFGRIYTPTSVLADAITLTETPVLETGDFTYNTITQEKEHDYLGINASKDMDVWVSTRDQLNQGVTWTTAGTWVVNQKFDRTFKPKSGKIHRFRFAGKSTGTSINSTVTNGTPGVLIQAYNTGFNGPVTALAARADGKIYAAGYFTSYRGVARNGIARLNLDGTLDTAFDPGTGFTVSSAYDPPTQLEVDPDGGVWCGLSFGRKIQFVTGVASDVLRYNGTVRSALIRLSATGVFVSEETDLTPAGDVVRFGGFKLTATSLFFTYARRGVVSTSNNWHTVLTRKDAGVLVHKRTVVSGGGISGVKTPDLAVTDSQVFWSVPRGLNGTATDILDTAGASLLGVIKWEGTADLGWFVFDLNLDIQTSWVQGAATDEKFVNKMLLGGRVEQGGFNNVYVSYLPHNLTTFSDGKAGKSLTYQHRGLFQFNLGVKDVATSGGFYLDYVKWSFINYVVVFAIPAGFQTINVEAYTGWFYGARQILTFIYAGVTVASITIGDNREETHRFTITLPDALGGNLQCNSNVLSIVHPSGEFLTQINVFSTDNVGSGGITDPNRWNLQPAADSLRADCGFTSSTSTDGDNTVPFTTPLTVIGNNQSENVYVIGAITKFKGEDLPTSAMWSVTDQGVLNQNFRVKLFNTWLSVDGVQRAGKVFCAIPYQGKLLIGGRFTRVDQTVAGHIALIDADTGRPVDSYQVTEGTQTETIDKGAGVADLEFYAYEQNLYAKQAQQ